MEALALSAAKGKAPAMDKASQTSTAKAALVEIPQAALLPGCNPEKAHKAKALAVLAALLGNNPVAPVGTVALVAAHLAARKLLLPLLPLAHLPRLPEAAPPQVATTR